MRKIISGFVIQKYDDAGKCIGQEFFEGSDVDFENDDDEPITEPAHEPQETEMVQPPKLLDEKRIKRIKVEMWRMYIRGIEYNKAVDQAATDFNLTHEEVREIAGNESDAN